MLGNFTDHRRVFIEVTKMVHEHGGPGWNFGTCLWSPRRNKRGSDSYALMRAVQQGDLVIHILEDTWPSGGKEHRIVGQSLATGRVALRNDEPPQPGDWVGQAPYYRVPLGAYSEFSTPCSVGAFVDLYDSDLRRDLKRRSTYYPFTLYGGGLEVRLRQGGYMNDCTPSLFDLVRTAVGEGPLPPRTPPLPVPASADADLQYKETKRLAGERYAFARNPGLVKAARALRGFTCEACDFNFMATYGAIGDEYIECHHVHPLGRRDRPTTSTTVRDVRMVCANCHRMIHRAPEPLAVEALRTQLGLPARPSIPGL
jgi:hypothetical protein